MIIIMLCAHATRLKLAIFRVIRHQVGEHAHLIMAKSAKDVFKDFYPKLLVILPVECLVTQFYATDLLSSDRKSKLDGLSTYEAKTKFFLDEVIERGLKIGYTEQFDEMLAFMAKSDDPPVKFLAKEINKSREIASLSRTCHDLNVDLARYQDAKTQGKDFCVTYNY